MVAISFGRVTMVSAFAAVVMGNLAACEIQSKTDPRQEISKPRREGAASDGGVASPMERGGDGSAPLSTPSAQPRRAGDRAIQPRPLSGAAARDARQTVPPPTPPAPAPAPQPQEQDRGIVEIVREQVQVIVDTIREQLPEPVRELVVSVRDFITGPEDPTLRMGARILEPATGEVFDFRPLRVTIAKRESVAASEIELHLAATTYTDNPEGSLCSPELHLPLNVNLEEALVEGRNRRQDGEDRESPWCEPSTRRDGHFADFYDCTIPLVLLPGVRIRDFDEPLQVRMRLTCEGASCSDPGRLGDRLDERDGFLPVRDNPDEPTTDFTLVFVTNMLNAAPTAEFDVPAQGHYDVAVPAAPASPYPVSYQVVSALPLPVWSPVDLRPESCTTEEAQNLGLPGSGKMFVYRFSGAVTEPGSLQIRDQSGHVFSETQLVRIYAENPLYTTMGKVAAAFPLVAWDRDPGDPSRPNLACPADRTEAGTAARFTQTGMNASLQYVEDSYLQESDLIEYEEEYMESILELIPDNHTCNASNPPDKALPVGIFNVAMRNRCSNEVFTSPNPHEESYPDGEDQPKHCPWMEFEGFPFSASDVADDCVSCDAGDWESGGWHVASELWLFDPLHAPEEFETTIDYLEVGPVPPPQRMTIHKPGREEDPGLSTRMYSPSAEDYVSITVEEPLGATSPEYVEAPNESWIGGRAKMRAKIRAQAWLRLTPDPEALSKLGLDATLWAASCAEAIFTDGLLGSYADCVKAPLAYYMLGYFLVEDTKTFRCDIHLKPVVSLEVLSQLSANEGPPLAVNTWLASRVDGLDPREIGLSGGNWCEAADVVLNLKPLADMFAIPKALSAAYDMLNLAYNAANIEPRGFINDGGYRSEGLHQGKPTDYVKLAQSVMGFIFKAVGDEEKVCMPEEDDSEDKKEDFYIDTAKLVQGLLNEYGLGMIPSSMPDPPTGDGINVMFQYGELRDADPDGAVYATDRQDDIDFNLSGLQAVADPRSQLGLADPSVACSPEDPGDQMAAHEMWLAWSQPGGATWNEAVYGCSSQLYGAAHQDVFNQLAHEVLQSGQLVEAIGFGQPAEPVEFPLPNGEVVGISGTPEVMPVFAFTPDEKARIEVGGYRIQFMDEHSRPLLAFYAAFRTEVQLGLVDVTYGPAEWCPEGHGGCYGLQVKLPDCNPSDPQGQVGVTFNLAYVDPTIPRHMLPLVTTLLEGPGATTCQDGGLLPNGQTSYACALQTLACTLWNGTGEEGILLPTQPGIKTFVEALIMLGSPVAVLNNQDKANVENQCTPENPDSESCCMPGEHEDPDCALPDAPICCCDLNNPEDPDCDLDNGAIEGIDMVSCGLGAMPPYLTAMCRLWDPAAVSCSLPDDEPEGEVDYYVGQFFENVLSWDPTLGPLWVTVPREDEVMQSPFTMNYWGCLDYYAEGTWSGSVPLNSDPGAGAWQATIEGKQYGGAWCGEFDSDNNSCFAGEQAAHWAWLLEAVKGKGNPVVGTWTNTNPQLLMPCFIQVAPDGAFVLYKTGSGDFPVEVTEAVEPEGVPTLSWPAEVDGRLLVLSSLTVVEKNAETYGTRAGILWGVQGPGLGQQVPYGRQAGLFTTVYPAKPLQNGKTYIAVAHGLAIDQESNKTTPMVSSIEFTQGQGEP